MKPSETELDQQVAQSLLNVNDLKQFIYCPRIVYYSWIMPLRPPATFLMERGHRLEEEFERLEPRRVLGRYGFENAVRHFSLQLTDDALGLTGKVDLILEGQEQIAVVEFKATARALAENWKIQLCAYGLLAGQYFQRPCPVGFVILCDKRELVDVELDQHLREDMVRFLSQARSLIRDQIFPEPTPIRARCAQCEYRNFCGDIF